MLPLMLTQKRSSLGCMGISGIALFGMLGGMVIGWLYGSHVIQLIAEQAKRERPDDPLDMLFFTHVVYIFLGALGGTIIGFIIGIVLNFKIKSRGDISNRAARLQ